MLSRAWATLTLKAVNDQDRTIKGIASTMSTDAEGDIIEPRGAEFRLPLPLLAQHDARRPIGLVTAAQVDAKQIEISATIPGASGLDYVEEAWRQIKAGLVRGLSVGFQPLSWEPVKDASGKATGGVRFLKWSWLELSAVTIPANLDANIATVKHFDPWGAWAAAHGQDPRTMGDRAESARDFDTVRRRAAAALVQSRRAMGVGR